MPGVEFRTCAFAKSAWGCTMFRFLFQVRVPVGVSIASVASFVCLSPAKAQTSDRSLPPVTVVAPKTQQIKQTNRNRAERPVSSKRRAAVATSKPQAQPAAAGVGGLDWVSKGDLSMAASAQPAATTVLDARQIARLPVNTYGDLFRSLPGFNVSNFGQGRSAMACRSADIPKPNTAVTSPITSTAFQ